MLSNSNVFEVMFSHVECSN